MASIASLFIQSYEVTAKIRRIGGISAQFIIIGHFYQPTSPIIRKVFVLGWAFRHLTINFRLIIIMGCRKNSPTIVMTYLMPKIHIEKTDEKVLSSHCITT